MNEKRQPPIQQPPVAPPGKRQPPIQQPPVAPPEKRQPPIQKPPVAPLGRQQPHPKGHSVQSPLPNPQGPLDQALAQQMFPPDLATKVLHGLVDWPQGFDECITQLIGKPKLGIFLNDLGSIDGRDRDSAALCLLSIELSHPGSTDYLQNSSSSPITVMGDIKPTSSKKPPSHMPSMKGGQLGGGTEIREQAKELFDGELYENMVSNILQGSASSPEGFDDCIINVLGENRLIQIRSSSSAEASDRDQAQVCLFSLGYMSLINI